MSAVTLAFPEDLAEQALCAQSDPDLFFPEHPGDVRPVRDAKRLCHRCPVLLDCLEWALDHREAFGIWGGTTPRERRELLAGRGINLPLPGAGGHGYRTAADPDDEEVA